LLLFARTYSAKRCAGSPVILGKEVIVIPPLFTFSIMAPYSAIMDELHKTHPNLAARPASDFEPVVREPDTLDLAATMGTTLLSESRIQFAPMFDLNSAYKTINLGGRKLMFSYNRNADLPDLVMYHDSFFFSVIPMLGEHFHSSVYVQNFSGGGLWNFSWVDERKPDVVIIEFAERYLDSLLTFIVRNQ